VEEEVPDDLKAKLAAYKPYGEANLRGHLKNPDDTTTQAGKDPEETPGSSAYVPKEPEKDTQLQYALSFLRGTATDARTVGDTGKVPEPAKSATPN
jgi:carboxyl-terminal processing protease